MKLPKLPLLAGRILSRLGQSNAVELSDEALVERIAHEQVLRTVERKVAQIARAKVKKKKPKLLEVSIVSGGKEG